ncbi:MAG TPA: hypothetical protein VM802_20660 [Chitinophaga sp.]|uniref:hypothetical protein n=1 Tax=Chitinophaga sp. TaxID=1869181 RepID=UPI002C1A1A64|nr:hypothetical protein [Chitinophaga sp.]HVI47302.1 hypothetical protein [Chitinophaga sp.]
MKAIILLFTICLCSLVGYSQISNVGVGTNSPTATLDVNGSLRVRTLPSGSVSTDSIVTNDVNGNIRRVNASDLVKQYTGFKQMKVGADFPIPVHNSVSTGSTGTFTSSVFGACSWKVDQKTTAPTTSDRPFLKVTYTLGTALTTLPDVLIFQAKNTSSYPDSYNINLISKSLTSFSVVITRVESSASWQGNFLFDFLMITL